MSAETAAAALQGLSEEEANLLNSDPNLLARFKAKHGLPDMPQEKPSAAWRSWEALRIPEQMVTQVLTPDKPTTTLDPDVSPSVLKTLATGAPRVMEESARDIGTALKKVTPKIPPPTEGQVSPSADLNKFLEDNVPSLVSRGTIVTAGGLKALQELKPMAGVMAKGLSRQLESASGSVPGSLEEAFQNPRAILAPGKSAASPVYEAAKTAIPATGNGLSEIPDKLVMVQKASELADTGKLSPMEALEARKELDTLKKRVPGEYFRMTRDKLDAIAKTAFDKADAAYEKGVTADSLRNIIPQNKYGGASAFKMGIVPALYGIGHAVAGPEGGKVGAMLAAGLLSPAVQGVGATATGIGTRAAQPVLNNPLLSSALISLARRRRPTN